MRHSRFYALTTFLPTYMRTEHRPSVLKTSSYLAVFFTATFFGYLSSGLLADRIGRRRNIVLFAAMRLASAVAFYLFVPITDTQMFFLGIRLGFFPAGIPAGIGMFTGTAYDIAVLAALPRPETSQQALDGLAVLHPESEQVPQATGA